MDENVLPPPLVGCLICHREGTVSYSQGRRVLAWGGDHLVLTCSHCHSVAHLDWDEADNEADEVAKDGWRIRYKQISRRSIYAYAALYFAKGGWIDDENALELSTQVFVHRERLQQVFQMKLDWLKPKRLYPPPPLMSADETVYLMLKPVEYCRTQGRGLIPRESTVLDKGAFYLTDVKIHLLGQQRDRTHRLSEIRDVELNSRRWLIHVGSDDDPRHYQGTHDLDPLLDGEMIISIIEALRQRPGG